MVDSMIGAIDTTRPCEPASAHALFWGAALGRSRLFVQAAVAALLANTLALFGALYSMQVYDRVIPTRGVSTLIVLTVGVLIAAVLELIVKLARARVLEIAVKSMDVELSQGIFRRLLRLRMDQFPATVGTLSAQLRSYETIRAFASSATFYLLVDVPFALLFLGVIVMLAGPIVAFIPVVFFCVAVAIGLIYRGRIARHAQSGDAASNSRLGLLVETVENAENIKSIHAAPTQMARWRKLCAQSMDDEVAIRRHAEHATYWAGFLQQTSYVLLVAIGAWIAATTTDLTSGGLIACSILSGRVLGPVTALPNLVVQWAHARSALGSLERVFALECDNHGVDTPLCPQTLHGVYRLQNVTYTYAGNAANRPPVLTVEQLFIPAGTKLALLGVIGSGKSTLLKLLAGLYAPNAGRVLLDDLDIQQIDRSRLARAVGYLPQEARLLRGTLRDNLTVGLVEVPDDDALVEACKSTGLIALVSSHPQGLDLPIFEGSKGLSGGQRQLVALTRLILARPTIWLLDEPTAAMDEQSEQKALDALRRAIAPEHTLVLVSHKPLLHDLIGRLAVLAPGGNLVMEGPRDAVIERLQSRGIASNTSVGVQRTGEVSA